MNPVISVIVPVYNVEKYLNQCVNSILAQTYKDFELILVDDGSKDKSGEICDEYVKKDSRIRVFHKKNGGVSSARNYGIDNAQGTYICFVDSDDWVDETYLEDMLKPGDYDWIIQGIKINDKYRKYKNEFLKDKYAILNALIENEAERDFLFRGPCSKLFKKDLINNNKLRYNTNIYLGEDYLFNICYINYIGNAYIYNSHDYNYRMTEGSLTHKPMPAIDILSNANIFKDIAKKMAIKYNCPKFYDMIMAWQTEKLFREFYRTLRPIDDRKKAITFLHHNATPGMYSYTKLPYSKFQIFQNLPFRIKDLIFQVIFYIMGVLKPVAKY